MKMKKKLLIGIIPVFVIGIFLYNKPISKIINVESKKYGTPANSAFQDENFYKCVVDNYNRFLGHNLSYDVSLTDEQLSKIKRLECSNKNIMSISGVEKLVNLEYFELGIKRWMDEGGIFNWDHGDSENRNVVKNVDLSHNVKLNGVLLAGLDLENVNLNGLSNLQSLSISDNNLSELDLSSLTSLEYLRLDNNSNLSSLDLSNNNNIKKVKGDECNISSFIGNSSLIYLDLSENNLDDVSFPTSISLEQLYLKNSNISSIDLRNNDNLKSLDLDSNQITSIDLSHNTLLMSISLNNNLLTSIDLSHNTALSNLSIDKNQLTEIDLSHNSALKEVLLDQNQLTDVDLSNCINLERLVLDSNHISNINLSQCVNLISLRLSKNSLSNIDLSNNDNLKYLYLDSNQITSIDLSRNTSLRNLDITTNPFSSDTPVYLYYGTESSIFNTYDFFSMNHSVILPNNLLYELEEKNNSIQNLSIGPNEKKIKFSSTISSLDYQCKDVSVKFLINVVKATSDKYYINDENSFIYVGSDTDYNTILSNISLSDENVTGSIIDGKYVVKYGDLILKSFDLIGISSDIYDLSKSYLYGNIDDIIDGINIDDNILNISLNLVLNKVEIKYGDIVVDSYDFVNYTSNKYDLSNGSINVTDNDISSFLNNTNCTNCNAYVYDGTNNLTTGNFGDNQTLRIIYRNEVVKEYELKYLVSTVSLNKNELKLNLDTKKSYQLIAELVPSYATNKNITWESSNPEVATVDENGLVTAKALGETTITVKTENGELTDTCNVIVTNTVIYKVTFKDGENTYTSEFEENENVIFKTDLEKTGYELVGWKYNNQNYSLTDKLTMPSNDIELDAVWELVIPELNNYESDDNNITGISIKTNVDSLNLGIDSIYEVKVSKHDGTDKTSGLVGTGDKVKIYLDNQLVSEYDVIIKGDVTGTGTSTVSDVAKLYQFLKGKIQMDECYKKAGNVVGNDNEIKINDVAKLYQFIKGKIDSL